MSQGPNTNESPTAAFIREFGESLDARIQEHGIAGVPELNQTAEETLRQRERVQAEHDERDDTLERVASDPGQKAHREVKAAREARAREAEAALVERETWQRQMAEIESAEAFTEGLVDLEFEEIWLDEDTEIIRPEVKAKIAQYLTSPNRTEESLRPLIEFFGEDSLQTVTQELLQVQAMQTAKAQQDAADAEHFKANEGTYSAIEAMNKLVEGNPWMSSEDKELAYQFLLEAGKPESVEDGKQLAIEAAERVAKIRNLPEEIEKVMNGIAVAENIGYGRDNVLDHLAELEVRDRTKAARYRREIEKVYEAVDAPVSRREPTNVEVFNATLAQVQAATQGDSFFETATGKALLGDTLGSSIDKANAAGLERARAYEAEQERKQRLARRSN